MWVQADPHAIIRRRQFVACVVLTIAVLLGAHLGGLSITSFPSVGSLDAGVTQAALPTVHVVAVGDSYGSIAAGLQQQAPLLTAEALRDLNGGAQLIPGQRLVLDLTSFG